ncbi:MAG: recombinase family protein, partial [Candidatus Hydrogenedentes bacterium]|nr:recombinase family protein [Candidatus Hydrogenedentota bacterium]
MMRKRRCAIYTRQSSVPSHRETSCNAQFDKCLKFIASMKPIGWEWIGTRYDDAGYGGATLDRPALQELIQLVAVGGVDIVVVEYLDRLSRSVVDVLTLMESFRDHGVDLRIVTCPDLTISPSDNFMINLLASFAEFERALIGERIREARAILKSHGKRVGGAVPFGYDADPLSKQRVVNAEESARVRAFFEMAAEGMTPSQIADVANERG